MKGDVDERRRALEGESNLPLANTLYIFRGGRNVVEKSKKWGKVEN